MRDSTRKGIYVSLPNEDADTLNALAWRTKRTRSEIVLEALRAYYPSMAEEYRRRVAGANETDDKGSAASG